MSHGEHTEDVIFAAALQLSADQRGAYLDKTCAGDADLRQRVEILIAAFEGAGSFMKRPAASLSPLAPEGQGEMAIHRSPTEKPGDRIGRYKLLEQIGEGGCGLVYVADQEEPVRRRVALKVIKLGMDTKQVIARFDAERQALAMMDHPNIAKVFDAGTTETGRPYFVMELVRGIKITDYCDQHELAPRERLDLFVQVCRAIQHAHQKGVIHRDIKPSNILVTRHDGVPVPKVIDFGIAKAMPQLRGRLTDQTVYTAFEQFIGTPAYMSPEQAEMSGLDIDTRTDIYSLGVLLYELLTGKTPFDAKELLAAGLDEMRWTIREVEPVKPSTRLTQEFLATERAGRGVQRARPSGESQSSAASGAARPASHPSTFNPQQLKELIQALRGDLDWIVMKCLEKDRARRYETANGLATDVQRHLRYEPVVARPPSAFYRMQKLARRNRGAFASVLVVVSAILLALIVLSVSNVRIRSAQQAERAERQTSDAANLELRKTVRALELQRAENFFQTGDPGLGAAHLAAILRRDPSNHVAASRLVSALVHRNWAVRAAPAMRHAESAQMVYFSPDSQRVLSASRDKTAKIWNATNGQTIATLQHEGEVFCARYDSTGTRIVTASADGTARIWSASDGEPLTPPLRHKGKVYRAEFSSGGEFVVTASADGTAGLWDAANGALRTTLNPQDANSELLLACFSPDGEQVATGARSGLVCIWNVQSGDAVSRIEPRYGQVNALAFSPDGARLAIGYQSGTAHLWRTRSWEEVPAAIGPYEEMKSLAFSPDSRMLLTGSQNGVGHVWNGATGARLSPRLVHEGGIIFGEFSKDGRKILTSSMDNTVRVWESYGVPFCQPLRGQEAFLYADFSPDGRRVLTAAPDGVVQIWNIEPRRYPGALAQFAGEVASVAFSRDGKFVVAASVDRTARVLDAGTAQVAAEPWLQHEAKVQFADFSPDGQRVVTTSRDFKAWIWNWRTGQRLAGPLGHGSNIWMARFSPDGDRVATASSDRTACVWNASNGVLITTAPKRMDEVMVVQVSANGKLLLVGADDGTVTVVDAATGRALSAPMLHSDGVKWAEFSPDGEKVLTASSDNTACLWDWRTGRKLIPPLRHTRIVGRARFSPDGRRIVTASMDLTARVWDAQSGQALTPPLKHDATVHEVYFFPDGQRILSSDWNGKARIWDADTGLPLTEWIELGGRLGRLALALDGHGQRFAAGGEHGLVRIWTVPRIPGPAPDWFPAFAEAVAGVRLAARGNLEIVPRSAFDAVVQRLELADARDFYVGIAKWFLADPSGRLVDPFAVDRN